MVGVSISCYPPGANDILFMSAAADLSPYLELSHDQIALHSSKQTIPMMTLLNLATFRMTSADLWNPTYFGHMVIKTGAR